MRFKKSLQRIGLLAVMVAAVLVPLSCNLFTTTLTITNNSSSDIDVVNWTDYDGRTYFFEDSLVFDTTVGWVDGLAAFGDLDTQEVGPGSDYVDFFFTDSVDGYRTNQRVSVDRHEDITFTFYDSTLIVARHTASGETTTEVYGIVPSGRVKPGAE